MEVVIFASWPVWLSPWDYTSTDWAGLTFVVLVVAAIVAFWQVREARRLREDQARPFVTVDFHPWSTLIELKIKNTGATLARDVQFDFDEPLVTTHDANSGRGSLMDLSLFKNEIPALVPGKEITLFFDQFPARLEAGLPMTYKLQVSYESPSGKRYSEPTVLDLQMYVGTGGITRHGLHDIHKQLKTMADTLKRWSDFEGLKVLTRSDIKRRNAALRAEWDEDEAASAANGEVPEQPKA